MCKPFEPPFWIEELEAVAQALRPHLTRTPALPWHSNRLADRLGATEVTLKFELFQQTGRFKPRGRSAGDAGFASRSAGARGDCGQRL